jgi:hypothetical protein
VSTLYFRLMAAGALADSSAPLERLLARADAAVTVTDWRADALSSQDWSIEPAAAPLALYAAHGPRAGAWTCFATAVHYAAEMSNVRLAGNGILRLHENTAVALAADFNRIWRDSGIVMTVGGFGDLFCSFDELLMVETRDPEAVLDRHIEAYLPQGPDAPRLRKLMSEMEMWLFEHPVLQNSARAAPALNGLWLWGGGATRTSAPPPGLNCAGDDALFSYFRGDVSRGGVVVAPAPGSADWPAAESQWLQPAASALKSGQLARLILSAADRCFTLRRSNLRRFWRRARPWSEYLA